MTQPVQEPTQGRIDSGQEWRSHQLFRRPATAGDGGIQFGGANPVYGELNVGEYLHVTTTGADTPVGLSIFFEALGGEFTAISDTLINLIAPQILAQITESFDVRLEDTGAIFQVDRTGGGYPMLTIEMDGDTIFHLPTENASNFRIKDSGDFTLWQLQEDGSLYHQFAEIFAEFDIITDGSETLVAITNEGVMEFRLQSASGRFTVYNNTGGKIFQVDEDGDLHGKTGKALTFDL